MGALTAILQSDPTLLRCQLHRLAAHVDATARAFAELLEAL